MSGLLWILRNSFRNFSYCSNKQPKYVLLPEKMKILMLFSFKHERLILHKRLLTSHAFHSAMMDPILKDFGEVSGVKLNRPQNQLFLQLPVIS
ncbi:hypothetical protein CS542_10065 [Pedobacter sp. IW39]|nr:hypothetical protein CS542_10065 [Pedobacter sp. IW39]